MERRIFAVCFHGYLAKVDDKLMEIKTWFPRHMMSSRWRTSGRVLTPWCLIVLAKNVSIVRTTVFYSKAYHCYWRIIWILIKLCVLKVCTFHDEFAVNCSHVICTPVVIQMNMKFISGTNAVVNVFELFGSSW